MRAALLVLVLAACTDDITNAPPGGPDGGGGDPPASGPRAVGLAETNRYRAMAGKPALVADGDLDAYAQTGAMVDFSGSPHQHFSSTQGGGIAFAENECPHWPGGDLEATMKNCIAAFFSEGPGTDYNTHGHYINLMSDNRAVGFGLYESNGEVTIVQDFGP